MKVYIASDFKNPPIRLTQKLECLGHTVSSKWWKLSKDITGAISYHRRIIEECDVFIFDMRTPRIGNHPLAGSHILFGIAYTLNKKCFLIPPDTEIKVGTRQGRKHYTSLSNFAIVENESTIIKYFQKS